ncbi:MAG TPA: hypothetical protein VHE37_05750, partial [Nevskiaceae bacterium]|nr:hypothetical protein [Nevskiaceae bacterium]
RIGEAFARTAELIESSGAEGFRPMLAEARARWSTDAAERRQHLRDARAGFERMRAPGHVARLDRLLAS